MPPAFEDHAFHADAVFRAAVAAADPARCVSDAIRRDPPPETEPAWVVAMGKAAGAMFEGFRAATGRRHEAVMVVPDGSPAQAWALRADHPLPTVRSVEAGQAVRDFVQRQARAAAVAGHGGFVVLISGGASALVSLPVPAISLARYRELTDALLRSGEPIGAINCVRKHCEQLKGGRLAELAAPAWVRAYILSDVIGDDPSDIASGPVSPDASTFEDAFRIASRVAPGASEVLAHLNAGRRGLIAETPKPGDPLLAAVQTEIVGSNRMGLAAAAAAARGLGFEVIHLEEGATGEAAEAGRDLGRRALEASSRGVGPAFVAIGCETTVRVGAGLGSGGRCQEMALAAALEVSGAAGIAIGAFATDGADGPADQDGSVPAGAVVTGDTARLCLGAGVDPGIALANHASRAALGAAGALVYSGPTGTNINDIAFALVYPR